MEYQMIDKICRFWDISSNSYIQDTMDIHNICSFSMKEDTLDIESKDNIIMEKCLYQLEDKSYLFEGDIIFVYDLFSELINHYIISYENGMVFCGNKDESILLSEVLKMYTIKKIDSYRILHNEGLMVYKNVCTECMCENIIIQPTGTTSFFCNKCGCMY